VVIHHHRSCWEEGSPVHIRETPEVTDQATAGSKSLYIQRLKLALNRIQKELTFGIQAKRLKNRLSSLGKESLPLKEGDKIGISVESLPEDISGKKLFPRYRGPYTIIKSSSQGRVLYVKDPFGEELKFPVSVSRSIPWRLRSEAQFDDLDKDDSLSSQQSGLNLKSLKKPKSLKSKSQRIIRDRDSYPPDSLTFELPDRETLDEDSLKSSDLSSSLSSVDSDQDLELLNSQEEKGRIDISDPIYSDGESGDLRPPSSVSAIAPEHTSGSDSSELLNPKVVIPGKGRVVSIPSNSPKVVISSGDQREPTKIPEVSEVLPEFLTRNPRRSQRTPKTVVHKDFIVTRV